MKRLHLFEFEDQPWFPRIIRDGMTDYLKFVANRFDFYKSVVPILAKGLETSGGTKIIDLASGGGGGWSKLVVHLLPECPDLKIVLTDRFPNKAGFATLVEQDSNVFTFEPNPVDARDVPSHLKGMRTQFLSFHHFKPNDARQILQNAVDAGQPIAIFEAQKRDAAHFVKFGLSPIAVLLMTPFIRPFKWSRIIFTYLIPAIPFFTFLDGVVSVLRTYSVEEMEELTALLKNRGSYSWEIGESKSGGVTVPYLIGYPTAETDESSNPT
jgi:hypothetical protein